MGETVAILGANDPPDVTKDLGAFMTHYKPYGVTTAANYTQFLLGGPNRDPVDVNAHVENALDAEMVLGMAPLAKVVHVIVATNTPGLFTDGISYIVNQLPQAHAVSVSYGSCERGSAQEMPVMNTLFQQARPRGSSGSSPRATAAPTAAATAPPTSTSPPAGRPRAPTSSASAAP